MSYNYDDIVFRTEARGSPGSALSSTFMGELSGDFKETCRHDPTLLLRTMTNVVRKFLREDSSPSCFPFDVQVEYRRGSVIVSLLLPLLWAISLDDVTDSRIAWLTPGLLVHGASVVVEQVVPPSTTKTSGLTAACCDLTCWSLYAVLSTGRSVRRIGLEQLPC